MLHAQTVVDAAVGNTRIVARGPIDHGVFDQHLASTPVISDTRSGVNCCRYSAHKSHAGRPVCVLPSLSFTSNSPVSAGSISGSNSDKSATQPATFDSSSRKRETS